MPSACSATFNSALASAKSEALAFLRSLIAGTAEGGIPQLRERRLAASQVLRTRFLRDDGSEAGPASRSRAIPNSGLCTSDIPHPTSHIAASPPAAHPLTPSLDHPLTDSPSQPSSQSEISHLKSEILNSEISRPASAVGDPSEPSAPSASSAVKLDPVAAMDALHAELREKARGLCGAEEKRLVKTALAELRAKQRAPI